MLESQKHLFSLDDDVHYLNCAYMSPLMKGVEKAGMEGIYGKVKPYKVGASDFFATSEALRKEFSHLIKSEQPERIAIIPSVSYGMAIVAKNLVAEKGQNIVVLGEQFPSNVYPWHKLAEKKGLEVRSVSAAESHTNRGKRWNQSILNSIDSNTCLVAVPHVHWSDGTLFDLVEIGRKAKSNGALLVIDGTQSVGALPFDVSEIKPDALICAGYKWLMGPYSVGLAYFGPAFDNGEPLEENWINRKDSENFAGLVDYNSSYQSGALRYDVGERSNFILLPMMLNAVKQINQWTVEAVQDYAARIGDPFWKKMKEKGFHVEDSAFRSSHLVGLRHTSLNTAEIQKRLTERNVYVSLRGSSIRVAVSVFNEENDLAALYEAL